MDGKRFDAIAIALATTGSRRRVLRALIGGAVAGLVSRRPIDAHTVTEECGLVDLGAIVFGDDFEGGDLLTRWDDVHGLVVDSGDGKLAVQGFKNELVPGDSFVALAKSVDSDDGTPTVAQPTYARTGLGTADGFDDLYFRVRFKVLDRSQEWVDLLSFRTVDDEPILGLGIDAAGQLRYRNDRKDPAEVSAEGVGSSDEWFQQKWHTVQVHLRLAEGNGRVEVWYDTGAKDPSLSNDVAFGIATVGRIQLGESAPRMKKYGVAFDEVVVATEFFRDCGTEALCCAGTCVPNDDDNCGTCGHACPGGPLPNASMTGCDQIGCPFVCNSNDFLDCDVDWQNGCERQQSDSSCTLNCNEEPVDCTLEGQLCFPELHCCCASESDLQNCGCSAFATSARYI